MVMAWNQFYIENIYQKYHRNEIKNKVFQHWLIESGINLITYLLISNFRRLLISKEEFITIYNYFINLQMQL